MAPINRLHPPPPSLMNVTSKCPCNPRRSLLLSSWCACRSRGSQAPSSEGLAHIARLLLL